MKFIVLLLMLLASPSSAGPLAHALDVAAVGDYSLYFPGVRPGQVIDLSGYVQVPYSPQLNPTGGEMTIEAWLKRDAADRDETIVGNGALDSYWLGFADGGKLRFLPRGLGSGQLDSHGVVPSGVWTHVAVTYDGQTLRYFINGVLDRASMISLGPIAPAPEGQPLGIGFDPFDVFRPNYFGGFMDSLRIWNVARNAAQIRTGMFQSYDGPHPHLLAEWAFDGDSSDPANGHDGILVGILNFSNEGGLPHDVRIPQLGVSPTLDGDCGNLEYEGATAVTIHGTGVRLMHSADDLWACFEDLGDDSKLAAVYLDAGYTRLDPAQPEHLRLVVSEDGSTQATAGNGSGSYLPTSAADGQWEGIWKVCCGDFPTTRAEFRISADLLHGWGHVVGLALSKVPRIVIPGVTPIPSWPALADLTLPSTWSSATLGAVGPQRTFSGQVLYQPRDRTSSPLAVAGATVHLIGNDAWGGEALLTIVQTSLSGRFTLTSDDDFGAHRLELAAAPKGYEPAEADADPPGLVSDARTIDYGAAPGGIYPHNVFTLGDALPYVADTQTHPYLQIIAPQQVIASGALDEFRGFKTRQGFAVGIDSVESIDIAYPGLLPDNIRTFEQARLAELGSRFQVVLLVGWDDVIPFVRFTPWFYGKDGQDRIDLDACLAPKTMGIKIKYSDWYYVDLVSDFDSNGNGCLLDGIVADFVKHPPAPGYQPDTMPHYQVTVAVGRIPFNTPGKVEEALRNSMRFEQQAEEFKRQALHAMSQPGFQGRYWAGDHYASCPPPEGSSIDRKCSSHTNDAAYVSEYARNQFMQVLGYISTPLYEETKPPGAYMLHTDPPLTYDNVKAALEEHTYGFVTLAGHGSSGGVGRTYWEDSNGNGIVEAWTEPPSVNEIKGAKLLDNSALKVLTPDNGRGAIYDIGSCSISSAETPENFGATLLDQGQGVASIGALNTTGGKDHWYDPSDGGTGNMQYYVIEKLLKDNLRVGDTLWRTLETLANDGDASAGLSTELYGDPTLSYWGNPGGQSTLAAWPMLRYDGRGQSYTTLTGPQVPRKQWEVVGAAPAPTSLLPSPVVSNNGEVIVAQGAAVDVLRHGELVQRLNLGASAYGAPALAADGTIYALDVNGTLYAFPYSHCFGYICYIGGEATVPLRTRRWSLSLGSAPATSPVVGSDGFIAVGLINGLVTVRPDGLWFRDVSGLGRAVGLPALGGDRAVYMAFKPPAPSSYAGHLARLDFFCSEMDPAYGFPLCRTDVFCEYEYTAPLLAYGSVYVGMSNGHVFKLTADSLQVQAAFPADARITAGPVAGPGGQVLVGTLTGNLYSLSKDLHLRWQRHIGGPVQSVPAFSADALYILSDNLLQAYHPFSGALLWSRDLGIGSGDGSVAVGYGRQVYAQTGSGKVVAYGEGWGISPFFVLAKELIVDGVTPGVEVRWQIAEAEESVAVQAGQAQAGTTALQGTPIGILVQRSAHGGPWEDLAVLPVDADVYYDTDLLSDTGYAYRIQVLDSAGRDSDFVGTLAEVRSLPRLPSAPQWLSVVAEGAETLGLEWATAQADVVDEVRVERSLQTVGPFVFVQQASGEVTTALDTELAPGTTYYYRVVAINAAGESPPSDVMSGTTRQCSLPTPQNVTATVLQSGVVRLAWDAGPGGATTVIEYSERGLLGFEPLGTADASGPWSHLPGEPSVYSYRLKFVRGDAESAYSEITGVTIPETWHVLLPLLKR